MLGGQGVRRREGRSTQGINMSECGRLVLCLWCTCVLDKYTTTLVNINQLTLHNSLEAPDLFVHHDKSLKSHKALGCHQ